MRVTWAMQAWRKLTALWGLQRLHPRLGMQRRRSRALQSLERMQATQPQPMQLARWSLSQIQGSPAEAVPLQPGMRPMQQMR